MDLTLILIMESWFQIKHLVTRLGNCVASWKHYDIDNLIVSQMTI